MLKIRLQKFGKKNNPSFRIVLVEHTSSAKSGKFFEILGSYNPRLKQKSFKKERIQHWLSKGVQVSPTVFNLLVDEKIIDKAKKKAWRAKRKEEEKPVEKPLEASQSTPVESVEKGVIEGNQNGGKIEASTRG